MINKSLLDLLESSMKAADAKFQEAAASPAARHLRLAGVELLRAARCGLDGAIDVMEPKHHQREKTPETKE